MARLGINTGTAANSGNGDTLRVAGGKINDNFLEIYTYLGAGSTTVLSAPIFNVTDVGINTLRNVGIGTTNPRYSLEVGSVGASGTSLWVNGNARITGILTVGSSSITFDGLTDTIRVGSGITINGSTGIISATSIIVGGTTITGSGVTYITAGSGISVDQNTGNVTITATGGGGSSSQWVTTAAGINTLSNVGIGTTNPQGTLQVGTAITMGSGVVTATSFSGSGANLTGLTGASANTYGNSTTVPQIVVDANGRITGITNVLISGGGGGGSSIIVWDGGSGNLIGAAGTIDFGAGLSVSTLSAGICTVTATGGEYASTAGIATYATTSGIATYASTAGISTYSTSSGIASALTSTSSVNTTGVITATSFGGSGSNLTGLTGASAGTYGSSTEVAQIVVDANNRITSISNVSITGGGGGDSWTTGAGTTIYRLSKVGIGTTNPGSADLAIVDNNLAAFSIGRNVDGTGEDHLGIWYGDLSNSGFANQPGAYVFTSNGNLRFDVDGAGGSGSRIEFGWGLSPSQTQMVVNSDGVGIGTTNPRGTLQVGSGVTIYGSTGIVSAVTYYGDGSNLRKSSRTVVSANTGSIGVGSTANININGFKSYSLLKVGITSAAWVVLYTDSASRTSDASRSYLTDPTPGSGVIAEIRTTSAGISTFIMSPGIIGWNNDVSVGSTIYAKVTNNESSTVSTGITVSLTVLKLED